VRGACKFVPCSSYRLDVGTATRVKASSKLGLRKVSVSSPAILVDVNYGSCVPLYDAAGRLVGQPIAALRSSQGQVFFLLQVCRVSSTND